MQIENLDKKVHDLIIGLPKDLSVAIRERYLFYKSKMPAMSEVEVLAEVSNLIRLEMLAYLDRRKYLGMYNRMFAEYKIAEYIQAIIAKSSLDEKDLYILARVNFDLNGLKALNDLAGHDVGNRGLKLFANILNFGASTLWLRDELELEVISSAEGGDEFGLVIFGQQDLREYHEEITSRYFEEVYKADVSHLINFENEKVRDNLRALGISDDVPKDFKFKMSTSVGLCMFGEAMDIVEVSREGAKYEELVMEITNAMFALADERSMKHKNAFKQKLGEQNSILSGLYARMSREVIHLERELKESQRRILELERKLKKR
ncbi:MAG TPA: hypothetical protein VJI73_02560 [Candidatus Paceibacterota bacterium]